MGKNKKLMTNFSIFHEIYYRSSGSENNRQHIVDEEGNIIRS